VTSSETLGLFRELSEDETPEFRKWARDNWTINEPISSVWHPTVTQECSIMLDEHIRANTKKYDAGTLDSNFAYEQMTVAFDSSTADEISEEEQFEMAIEYFWESEWERLTGKEPL
tara:strand:+ start:611 stop:958 length:348 start_codon:yes stop_codon:yes gene_type:complete